MKCSLWVGKFVFGNGTWYRTLAYSNFKDIAEEKIMKNVREMFKPWEIDKRGGGTLYLNKVEEER